jgi:hypothetical protein
MVIGTNRGRVARTRPKRATKRRLQKETEKGTRTSLQHAPARTGQTIQTSAIKVIGTEASNVVVLERKNHNLLVRAKKLPPL